MSRSKRRRKPARDEQHERADLPYVEKALLGPRFHAFAIVGLCVLGALIYCNSFAGPFVFDDVRNIAENQHIRVTSLDWDSLYDAAVHSRAPRPVAYFSFALNYYLGEYEVAGYHLGNLLIHLINGVLVYALAFHTYRLYLNGAHGGLDSADEQANGWMSLLAAGVFIAHPLQSQAVVYIVQRMTSLATMFYLLALLLYIQGRLAKQAKARWGYWIGCALSGLLAMGSKQIAATLPISILLYEWFFFQDLSKTWLKQKAKYLAVLLVISVAFAVLCLGTSPWDRISDGYALRDFSMGERLMTQFRVVMQYLSFAFLPLPSRLNLLHDVPISHSLFSPITTLLSLLVIAALTTCSFYYANRQRLLSFGILWLLLHLIIESSILSLEIMYEHRMYLPMFGLVLILPYALYKMLSTQVAAAVVVATLLVLSLAWGSHQRTAVWQDELSFWADVIVKSPQAARAYVERGKLYARQGQLDSAIADYSKAIEIKPSFAIAYSNRGAAYGQQKKLQQAVDDCTQAITLKPDYSASYNNRGTAYNLLGKKNLAVADYSKAIELNPFYTDAYFNRGNIYNVQAKYQLAIEDYSNAINQNSNFAVAYSNRSIAYERLGEFSQAIDDLHIANNLLPNEFTTTTRLAWLLATSPNEKDRNGPEAKQLAQQACEATNWNNTICLETYAASCAENGDFAEAIKWQSQATQSVPPNQKNAMLARLERYLAKKAYRLPTGN